CTEIIYPLLWQKGDTMIVKLLVCQSKSKQNNGLVSSSKGREDTKICMQYEEIGQDSEESVWHNLNKWSKYM
ncbi:hypothetical protein VIGAN_07065000, partial [Vigna angularis var. angularis]